MMDRGEITREQVSALADGELDEAQTRALLDRMSDPALRATWDRYHQIGDLIRSDEMAVPVRTGVAARVAARLASEPALLAPRRSLLAKLGAWPAALAAVAAAGVGFFIAPGMFGSSAPTADGALVQVAGSSHAMHGVALAESSDIAAVAQAGAADYIRLHQSAHPALYGMAPLARPVVLDDSGER